ncbi:MAG: hypothetical protein QOF42_1194 [Gammaproteobacteria bacterium]|jgi:hypothetical protein|nr:hypothetical protein [Gammaproteobacteria bacterium]
MKVGSAPNAVIGLRHGQRGYFAVIGYCTVDMHSRPKLFAPVSRNYRASVAVILNPKTLL